VPGCQGSRVGGTDFTDISSMFCRVVVEGLFGYRPDYPNGVVTCAPRFPDGWDHAEMATPDFRLAFRRQPGEDTWRLELTQPARVVFEVPVRARRLGKVRVNGVPAEATVSPGFGCTLVHVETGEPGPVELTVQWEEALPAEEAPVLETDAGAALRLTCPYGPIVEVHDPQGMLSGMAVVDGGVDAVVGRREGHGLVFGRAQTGVLEQWRLFRLRVRDREAEAARAADVVVDVPAGARWHTVDLAPQFNGDVRTIFQQAYLSPRPETCSVRIGSDGYSAWTFYYWNRKPPAIDLSGVAGLRNAQGRLVTPKGVPFAWRGDGRNIAFTSLWDNWPGRVTAPVGRAGSAAWLLVCGSTNPMQTRIANAALRLRYADGTEMVRELVPPLNFWSLCPYGGSDYDYARDGFCLPGTPPDTVTLGANCRAVLVGVRMRPGVALESVTLEALSPEVVIGLMGLTVME